MDKDPQLIAYWVVPKEQHGVPFGIGVTAFSIDDALALIRERGWPLDLAAAQITENVKYEDLDRRNVVPNMGPMVFRGIWYPCFNIGWGASGSSNDV